MRFMVIYKANKDFEQGAPPDPQLMADMNKFIDELIAVTGLMEKPSRRTLLTSSAVALSG